MKHRGSIEWYDADTEKLKDFKKQVDRFSGLVEELMTKHEGCLLSQFWRDTVAAEARKLRTMYNDIQFNLRIDNPRNNE